MKLTCKYVLFDKRRSTGNDDEDGEVYDGCGLTYNPLVVKNSNNIVSKVINDTGIIPSDLTHIDIELKTECDKFLLSLDSYIRLNNNYFERLNNDLVFGRKRSRGNDDVVDDLVSKLSNIQGKIGYLFKYYI